MSRLRAPSGIHSSGRINTLPTIVQSKFAEQDAAAEGVHVCTGYKERQGELASACHYKKSRKYENSNKGVLRGKESALLP